MTHTLLPAEVWGHGAGLKYRVECRAPDAGFTVRRARG